MMPEKKSLGRWPVIFADYEDAVNGKIKPIPRELFLDYNGKDAYFYSPTGEYVSIISLIRSGIIQSWLPPCVSYNVMVATYPDPDLSSVCAVIDTGIIYEYVGNGAWIPISANSIPLASSTTNGLMSSTNYTQLQDCYNRTNIVFVDLNGYVPLPYKRAKNTIYEICKEVCVDPNEIIYDYLELIDSVEGAIKHPWDWDQLFDFDLESGEIWEITDGLHKIVTSDMLIDPDLVIPDGYMYAHYMYPLDYLIENLEDAIFAENAYSDDWKFTRFYDFNEKNEVSIVTNIGYDMIESNDQLGENMSEVGKNSIDAVYYMSTAEVANASGDEDTSSTTETETENTENENKES
jgi:hypothetical protein